VQDPASAPARITEGILPLRMKHGNFVISGAMWRKFNANRPWMTFVEFWMFKEHAYDCCNAQLKRFLKGSRATQTNIMRSFGTTLFVEK
jgi:hypothetical protein